MLSGAAILFLILLMFSLPFTNTTTGAGFPTRDTLNVDRVIEFNLSLHDASHVNDTNRTYLQFEEEVLPNEIVQIVYNLTGLDGATFLEFTVGINWTGIFDPDPMDSNTPASILMEYVMVSVEGLDALNVSVYDFQLNTRSDVSQLNSTVMYSNSSMNGTISSDNTTAFSTVESFQNDSVMFYCLNDTTYMECYFFIDLLGLLLIEDINNDTLIKISVPLEINYEAMESSWTYLSVLVYEDNNFTGNSLDVVLTLPAIRPILELFLGEAPLPGCPSDIRYVDAFLQHSNSSQTDAFQIRHQRRGSFRTFVASRPTTISSLEIGEEEMTLIGIILPFIQPGDHQPIVQYRYRDSNRNTYFVTNNTDIYLKSYPLWSSNILSSFSSTMSPEVTVFEYFNLDMVVRTPRDYALTISVHMCAKYAASFVPVILINTTVSVNGINHQLEVSNMTENPDTGCWPSGFTPPVSQNCSCWEISMFVVPESTVPDPVIVFVFQVDANASQGERIAFTGSVSENITNGSCIISTSGEQEVEIVEPTLITVKTLTVSMYVHTVELIQHNSSHRYATSRYALRNLPYTYVCVNRRHCHMLTDSLVLICFVFWS